MATEDLQRRLAEARKSMDRQLTEIHGAAEELKARLEAEAQTRLFLALDVAGAGMWDWTFVNDTLVWDTRMCRLFDEPEGSADAVRNYQAFFGKILPEDCERVQGAIDEALTGKPYDVMFTVVWRDGSRHLIHARGLRYPNHSSAKKLIGVCMEIVNTLP